MGSKKSNKSGDAKGGDKTQNEKKENSAKNDIDDALRKMRAEIERIQNRGPARSNAAPSAPLKNQLLPNPGMASVVPLPAPSMAVPAAEVSGSQGHTP